MIQRFFITLTLLITFYCGYAQVAIDSNAVIYGWMLDKQFVNPILTEIDTNLVNYQLHNKVTRKYYSLTTIGSYGSPYLQNEFFHRRNHDDLLFLNSYIDYFNTYDNTLYLNTRKPFSHLEYIQSWPKSDREEYLNVFHSQNITKKWNFGVDISIISDKSQYRYQNTNNKAFKVFSSYTGANYKMHLSLNLNRYFSGESAGVIDSSYYFSNWRFTKEIQTTFTGSENVGAQPYSPNVTNKIRYMDGMLSQNLKLFSIGGKSDDSLNVSTTIAQPIVSHVFKIRRASKIYENTDANNMDYYQHSYSNTKETYDSASEYKVANTLQLDFKTRINKVIAGVYGSVNHEYHKFNYFSLFDTASDDTTLIQIDRTRKYSDIFVSAGVYGKFWTNFESRFNGTIYLSGYKAGQTIIDGLVNTNVKIRNYPFQLYVAGAIENISPTYMLNTYYSNHYIWNEDFKNTNKLFLSSKIAAPSNRFELEGNYTLLSNHIYLTDSMPLSYNQPMSISALTIQKEFVVWKFHSFNRLTYQVTENRSIIELPSLLFFNSTYIDHTWRFKLTNGWLRTMLGVDIYYNTGFNGYDYNPALAMFYQSDVTTTVGNYPYIDVWLNVRLKRTRFFLKYEHVNSSDNLNHFYALNYPAKRGALKFGLSWTFYD
jgi:hypothetical protein